MCHLPEASKHLQVLGEAGSAARRRAFIPKADLPVTVLFQVCQEAALP
jgi:hypothetical protein